MPAEPRPLTFTQTVNVPPAEVYQAFTNRTALREWLADGAVSTPRQGGNLYLWWDDGYYASGEYTDLQRDRHVAFTWYGRGEPLPTQVSVTLEPDGEGTHVTLSHDGLTTADVWDGPAQAIAEGWHRGLENLRSVLETGDDLRVSQRPMLGITVAAIIDEQLAEQMGLPVSAGVQVDDVLEGMGAAHAGIQHGDVIVKLGDTGITDMGSFGVAVAPYNAGDEVPVTLYRGAEEQTIGMVLSARPIPTVPDNPADLAAGIREIYDRVLETLEGLLEGVSEGVASYQPGEREWSIKHTLAHLILSERDNQLWVASVLSDRELIGYADNMFARVSAVLEEHSTVEALMAELRRAVRETVALIAHLPDEAAVATRNYVRVGTALLSAKIHPTAHLRQIEDLLEAAPEAA